ncbi:MAG: monooxygenase [Betaproteobacteria bacterium]|nr:monooxygenase [Betaproteobacteria bacterium]
MRERTRILIAGGGIGGFTAAVALLQRGFSIEILEKAPQLGEVGAGVQNSPNATRIFNALGLMEEVEKDCNVPQAREVRLWNTGEGPKQPTRNADFVAKYRFPFINMHRADLHRILVDSVKRDRKSVIRLGANCVGFEQDADGVTVSLEGGERVRGSAFIAADGIHSVIRRQLFGPSKAKFTGGVAWRGLIPIERLPKAMRERNGETWLGRNGHITVYPVRRGEFINVVGHIDRDDWQVESWIERGETAEFARDFAGWHEEIQTMIHAIETPYKWALFLHDTLPSWSNGRVTLLGDACHPMLPYLGQGANMAIEDGYVLGRCFDACENDIPAALRCYEAARLPRTTRVVNESAANMKRFRTPAFSDPAQAREFVNKTWDSQMDLRAWIYAYDATTAPITEARQAHA